MAEETHPDAGRVYSSDVQRSKDMHVHGLKTRLVLLVDGTK